MRKREDFRIIDFRPSRGYAVAERPDGRRYHITIRDGKIVRIHQVFSKTNRLMPILNQKFGQDIEKRMEGLFDQDRPEYYIYNGKMKLYED